MIDRFLDRQYTEKYHCSHFVVELWRAITGHDVSFMAMTGQAGMRGDVTFLDEPQDPCIVVLTGGSNVTPHCGVLYRGMVRHLTADNGVVSESLKRLKIGYSKVRFFV